MRSIKGDRMGRGCAAWSAPARINVRCMRNEMRAKHVIGGVQVKSLSLPRHSLSFEVRVPRSVVEHRSGLQCGGLNVTFNAIGQHQWEKSRRTLITSDGEKHFYGQTKRCGRFYSNKLSELNIIKSLWLDHLCNNFMCVFHGWEGWNEGIPSCRQISGPSERSLSLIADDVIFYLSPSPPSLSQISSASFLSVGLEVENESILRWIIHPPARHSANR